MWISHGLILLRHDTDDSPFRDLAEPAVHTDRSRGIADYKLDVGVLADDTLFPGLHNDILQGEHVGGRHRNVPGLERIAAGVDGAYGKPAPGRPRAGRTQ